MLPETEHYRIESSATPEQTREIGLTAEIVYAGYAELMTELQHEIHSYPKLKMKLFKDRDEFHRCNLVGWADGLLPPALLLSVLLFCGRGAHPYHWMMHEATHQLNAEVARLVLPHCGWTRASPAICRPAGSWRTGSVWARSTPTPIPCGGSTRLDSQASWSWTRRPGGPSLRAILSGDGGPDLSKHFNLYYLHWWSLAHFLIQCDNGMWRAGPGPSFAKG